MLSLPRPPRNTAAVAALLLALSGWAVAARSAALSPSGGYGAPASRRATTRRPRPLERLPGAARSHAGDEGMVVVGRRWRGRLFLKYSLAFVLLVSSALLAGGLVQVYFAYGENEAVQLRLQQEKASAAAATLERFVADIVRDLGWTQPPEWLPAPPALEQRLDDYARLLRQVPAITELTYLDAAGREQLYVSQVAPTRLGSGRDQAASPAFQQARPDQPYFGPVYFRDGSEPYMTVALAERGAGAGVTVAEVSLRFLWDVILPIQIGREGYAYVVDSQGDLIAHPDLSLVLQGRNLAALPQVQGALAPSGAEAPVVVRNLAGREVLAAAHGVQPPGWTVFVEQPLTQALAPLYASAQRTAVLLLIGLGLSVLLGLILARKMVTPIRALQASAARIGAGALEQRIEVHSGDELDALAEEFNRMSARLRESYASLEDKVAERTQELGAALAALEEKSRQLAVASQHKSEFLANMSHELRTPLNAIIGFSDVLLEQMFGELNPKQEEYLQDILSSGHHLLALINDILDLAKVEAGRMELEPTSFLLAETLESGLTMVRERAARHGITLDLEVDPALGVIEADERKIKQVVFNLLSNAVKFTPDGGRVAVRAWLDGDWVQVAVRDTGVGIAPADQERVFEEFQRVGGPEAPTQEGTGLGLPLARKLVSLHGGRGLLESAVGQGSTVAFAIPVRQGAAKEAAGKPRPAETGGLVPPTESRDELQTEPQGQPQDALLAAPALASAPDLAAPAPGAPA